jgi:hypothetical protein
MVAITLLGCGGGKASQAGGNSGVDTSVAAPTGLIATAVATTQVNLSWNGSSTASGYHIYRNGTQVGTTAAVVYQDTGVSSNTSYSYTVDAFDGAGHSSSQSTPASVKTPSATTCDIVITPSDSYDKIEAATPGQTVCISPGTYHFRLNLAKAGTATAPIIIKALDPANRPVFDYTSSSHDVSGWPGSYSAGDAVRSAWRVTGSYYVIDGIIIQGANNAFNNWKNYDNTAGIRYLNSSHLTVRNCRLYNNDMGIQGGGSNTVIEYTEFDHNGAPASDQSHNLYILGGDVFTLQYSYLHDSVGGQNFHIRARSATVAYNWIQNAADYEGDMMANQSNYDAGANGVQSMLFIGNVVVQNANPANPTKLIVLFNSPETGAMTMNLTAVWNTFVFKDPSLGTQSTNSAPIQFNKGGSYPMNGTITFSNNIVAGLGARSAVLINTAYGTLGTVTIAGTNNFFITGSNVSTLTNTKFASDVLFTNAGSGDYTLQSSSPAFGFASNSVTPQPAWHFSTLPFSKPAALASDLSPRTILTNPGAL